MAPMMQGGSASSTYTFSSQPKPVTASRKKYRDPSETDIAVYRDLKETCITWDKRVHRGNTYGMYTQNAIKEALQDATSASIPKQRRMKRKPKEPNLFDMPPPEPERIPVDLTAHLVAKEEVIMVDTAEAQTDEFLPEPPPEEYQPPKTGIDAYTQIEEGELFNFDYEVEPILDVLVNKTLEQSIMEVEEEHEMQSMKEFKDQWYSRQKAMMKEWQVQVKDEWRRWEEKEALVARKQKEKREQGRVLLKIQAMSVAKKHLSGLIPNSVSELTEVAFPDERGMAIDRVFLPQLLGQVQQQINDHIQSRNLVDEIVANCVEESRTAHANELAVQRERTIAMERKSQEERHIRKGRIRILVDDGEDGTIAVGPVQISSEDDIEQVHENVFEWLSENEPDLAASWPWGVTLLLSGEPVTEVAAIFDAKAGEVSMVPKPEPPPPQKEEEPDGDEEGSEGDDDQ